MNALALFPKALESQLIEIACEHGLTRDELRCHMTRQQGYGHVIPKQGFWEGEMCPISYDLMLCEYCGNLMPQTVCPYKARIVCEKLLNA